MKQQKTISCHSKTNELEEWKPVKGYEGYYEVSSFGNIRSLNRMVSFKGTLGVRSGSVKRQSIDTYGYRTVCLCRDGKEKAFKVHRLVAQAFISNPENKPQVNHKNGNKTDNRASELEWVTGSENAIHAYEHNLNRKGKSHENSKAVIDTETGAEYFSIKEMAKELGLVYSTLKVRLQKQIPGDRFGYRKTNG